MNRKSTRFTFVTLAWIALGAAGYFLFTSQQSVAASASAVRAVDLHAHDADAAIADLRVAQQAYVASGQGMGFWTPKVAATVETANAALNGLRQAATNAEARAAGEQAAAAISEFIDVDKRARDYIRSGQTLMAADVIFTEGGQLTAVAARQVETARQAEHQAYDGAEAAMRRQQATVLGVGAGIAALIALLLGLTGTQSDQGGMAESTAEAPARASLGLSGEEGIVSHARKAGGTAPPPQPVAATAPPVPAPAQARGAVVLKAAADLSTDFGRVRDADELSRLLARTADLLDASGLIVWMAEEQQTAATGARDVVLRPALAHGYSTTMLAKMPVMPRSADNAAAAACRTGALQIVLSKPGGPGGAVVAPILTADGCVGALSAEIKSGGEGSEAVQAVAAIVAAHLASVVGAAPAEAAGAEQARAAHG